MRKRKELTEKEIINYWLEKYHNTNIDKIAEEHPDWTHDNPEYEASMFLEAYQVTNEQYDEWHDWVIKELCRATGQSKKSAERSFVWIGLLLAPMIKK